MDGRTQHASTVHGVLRLPPVGTSAGAARRFVVAALQELGLEHLEDSAALAVSELVTNAVLHTHTEVEVSLSVDESGVRVDVADLSDVPPVLRSYGTYATTGRGLGLVAAVAEEVGVAQRETGKSVWFTLPRVPVPGAEGAGGAALAGFDEWDLDLWDEAGEPVQDAPLADAAAPGVAVLHEVPVTLWLAARQHHDAALRELVLYRESRDLTGGLAWSWYAAASTAHTVLGTAIDRAVVAALLAGVPVVTLPFGHPAPVPAVPARVDVEVPLDPELPAGLEALAQALDDADLLAAQGELLVRPALPEVVALRDWCCHQVIAQAGGAPAAPWGGLADADADAGGSVSGSGEEADSALRAWDDDAVRRAPGAVVAADDNNRIVAISAEAERLLGWDAADLVGRRVVTLIPPRLREAHVAGFTRHQVTGQAHVLGVEVVLPVLHAQGHEIECRFLIERAPAASRRWVYLASLTPV